MQHPPPVRPDLRIIEYIREIADDRKARAGGASHDCSALPGLLRSK